MQKFNSNNMEARFIKNILKNTYLPSIPTVADGDYIVGGVEYCYKNNIIQCKNTGILVGNTTIIDNIKYVDRRKTSGILDTPYKSPTASDFCICSRNFKCGAGLKRAEYDIIGDINYNTYMPGVNTNYISHSSIYDVDTHKQLGKYLRYYRDVKNINLMPMYNCFCNETTSALHIADNTLKLGNNNNYYVWLIPAQLNKEYTLYINSPHPISVCGTFLNNYGRIKKNNTNNKYLDELLDNKIINYNGISYNTPIKYKIFTDNPHLLAYNNNFYILVQTVSNEFSSIVAIEGEHNRNYHKFITNSELHNTHVQNGNLTLNYSSFSPPIYPSMTITPISYYTPYAPRLIEFLTEQTITNEEDIPNNILRIQKALNSQGRELKENDVWNDELKYHIYNNYFKYSNRYYLEASQLDSNHKPKEGIDIPRDISVYNKNNELVGLKNCKLKREFENIYDITGYIDKDIENSLFKYRSV